jgi:RHS repeat-associated protein
MVSEAFGKTFVDTTLAPTTTGTTTNNLRFPGQYEDVETGTYYNYMRTYLPMVGRYGESDPIGLDGGANLYLYADSDGINIIDPYGEKPKPTQPKEKSPAPPSSPDKPKDDKYRRKPKICNDFYYNYLKGQLDQTCKPDPGKCDANERCSHMQHKIALHSECAVLRKRMMKDCFDRHRDANHEFEATKRQGMAYTCIGLLPTCCP